MSEQYTLGYTQTAVDFVARRTLESHGAFFIPYLQTGMKVLDCGCGPGTMTFGIAARTAHVTGIDFNPKQIELAQRAAKERGFVNADFRTASVYELPFPDASFDAAFSHALLEHLSDVPGALREIRRVLKPGGPLGACTPDWGGFLFSPATPQMVEAVRRHNEIQDANGGDTRVGRKLLPLFQQAGYEKVRAQSRYENYEHLSTIADIIALQVETHGDKALADQARAWGRQPEGMFSQAWVSCVGFAPGA